MYSLYFHVPFCTQKCPYCHFYVIPNQERFRLLYQEALRKEWELRAPSLASAGKLVSIYFGGGTPHLLGAEMIDTILSWISPSREVEITIETNPEIVAPFPKATRVSVGVQSLDTALLTTLQRAHTVSDSYRTIAAIREAGIDNITIDLMYDLPGQSLESWQETLASALSLPITHLSLYNLTLEPHTAFYKQRTLLAPHLPDAALSVQLLNTAIDQIEAAGFERYEISAFAKPGFRSQHNIGYWTGRPFLGFGPSASSYWEGARFRNIPRLHRYAQLLEAGTFPIDSYERLSPCESQKEGLALRLRLLEPIAVWPEACAAAKPVLDAAGFLDPTQKKLSRRGLLFHDTVAEIIMNTVP